MYTLNKIVGAMTNPFCLSWCMIALALVIMVIGSCINRAWLRIIRWLIVLALCWLWIWSIPATSKILGMSLEREYLVEGKAPSAESMPLADAIELHGGGMGVATNILSRGEMWLSADRVWMAARLWKLGKAPIIFVTGTGSEHSTVGLLRDFGVPDSAMVFAESARNTEEEARWVGKLGKMRLLVVTSAWHMKRTMLMYRKYAPTIETIPVPCDFENTAGRKKKLCLNDFLPSEGALYCNCVAFHELVGIIGYQCFRK